MEYSIRLASVTVLLLLVLCMQSCHSETFPPCETGECINATLCQTLRKVITLNILNKSKEVIEVIKQHRCGDGESRNLCCTELAVELDKRNILPSAGNDNFTTVLNQLLTVPCGYSPGSNRIIAGKTALLFEFPWMALLEYNTPEGSRVLCGGSLISDQYVLTAAHCFALSQAQLVSVRLGEYNTSSEIDCDNRFHSRKCLPPVENHEVEDVIIHKDFKAWQFSHDIALIRLKNKTYFGERILPICLPFEKYSIEDATWAEVAGWGYTPSGNVSNVLQKVTLPLLANEICEKVFAKNLSSLFVCAGGQQGSETCKGDSGGPLFTRTSKSPNKFVIYGVLSGGGLSCGGNNTLPSVYTNVTEHLEWIVKNMKP